MCQYDTDASAQGHPRPHACILQKMKFTLNQTWSLFYDYIPCIEYESNTLMFSKDIKRKLFFNVEKGP